MEYKIIFQCYRPCCRKANNHLEVKMNNPKSNFSILKDEITAQNVMAMAELIAISETKFLIGYMGSCMQKLHNDLYVDIIRKNDMSHTFSDSYDLVQECALYLCGYFGRHLNEVVSYSSSGKPITIEIACIKKMMKLVNRKTSDSYRTVSLDALTPASEPSCETKEEVDYDYAQYDRIVDSLNLTDNMRIALECRITGLSYPEIGRVLSRTQSTVYEYFIKMRQRYIAIYG